MNKDTALERLDKVRDLISRLPEDALVVNVDLEYTCIPSRPLIVHVFNADSSDLGGDFEVVSKIRTDISNKRYEHRFYPAKDIENAGYIYVATSKEAVK